VFIIKIRVDGPSIFLHFFTNFSLFCKQSPNTSQSTFQVIALSRDHARNELHLKGHTSKICILKT